MTKKQKIKVSPTTADITDKASEFMAQLCRETDRGAALVAAAFIEETLELILRSVFVSNAKVQRNLLKYPGPLTSFASKIDLMHAMGLFPAKLCDLLHLIRRIRNEFGHSHRPADFNAPKTSELCRRFEQTMRDGARSKLTSRDCFLGGAVNLVNALLGIQVFLRKAKPGGEYRIERTSSGAVAGQVSCTPPLLAIGHIVFPNKGEAGNK